MQPLLSQNGVAASFKQYKIYLATQKQTAHKIDAKNKNMPKTATDKYKTLQSKEKK